MSSHKFALLQEFINDGSLINNIVITTINDSYDINYKSIITNFSYQKSYNLFINS